MARIVYRELKKPKAFFYGLVALHIVVVGLLGLGSFWYMEHHGHIVSGMNNQVVWGTPHVFAVFLIVAASGALNVASISSVFAQTAYKPFARLSGLLAIALLLGGLFVLVLDLGRPDRLTVAMTTYNFKSIFAWNIYLYTGFMVIVAAYLWTMMSREGGRFYKPVAYLAFGWRLILTTGTGSIFGFLVAREAYDAALYAPLFIASSFAYGLAFMVLVLMTMGNTLQEELMSEEVISKFRRMLVIFILATFYFTVVMHLTNLYAAEHQGVERFILFGGNIYTTVLWVGQFLIGMVLPMLILLNPTMGASRSGFSLASILVLLGGVAQMYVIIVGGQAYPLNLFPGMEVTSTFADGQVGQYTPSLPEVLLGVSGVSLAMLITAIALMALRVLPRDPARQANA
ncbi:MAG: molybdopterin oxidoreductase [Hyphomicrobiales bacterium]|nr:MAG: molybdopterin oxidoreductase [Hyphomicrobiales bacterium]